MEPTLEQIAEKRSYHKCSAKDCKNNSRNCNFSFFCYPKNLERAKQWANACLRNDLADRAHLLHGGYRVCGEHFEDTMFLNNLKNRLQPNAIPTPNIVKEEKPKQNTNLKPILPRTPPVISAMIINKSSNTGNKLIAPKPNLEKVILCKTDKGPAQNVILRKQNLLDTAPFLFVNVPNSQPVKWITPTVPIVKKLNPDIATIEKRPLVEKQFKIHDHDYCLKIKRSADDENLNSLATKRKKSDISVQETAKKTKSVGVQATQDSPPTQKEQLLQLKVLNLQKEKNTLLKMVQQVEKKDQVERKEQKDDEIFDSFLSIAEKYLPRETVILIKGQASIYHKKPKGRRYSEEFKEFCNGIFVKEPRFYKVFATLFSLPSRTTLCRQKN